MTTQNNSSLPTIVIDSREQTPLQFHQLPTVTAGLVTGDYSIAGLEDHFAVERKSIADLVGSVIQGRERFERELCRMRGHEFRRLLIIGTRADIEEGRYVSKALPKAVMASVDAFEVRYQLPVVWISCETEAATTVERWAWYFVREMGKRAAISLATRSR